MKPFDTFMFFLFTLVVLLLVAMAFSYVFLHLLVASVLGAGGLVAFYAEIRVMEVEPV